MIDREFLEKWIKVFEKEVENGDHSNASTLREHREALYKLDSKKGKKKPMNNGSYEIG